MPVTILRFLAMIGEEHYRIPEQLPGRCGICGAPARQDGFGVTVASADYTGSVRLCASCVMTRTAADVLAEAIRLDQRRRAAWQAEYEAEELARDLASAVTGWPAWCPASSSRFPARGSAPGRPGMGTASAPSTTRCMRRKLAGPD